MGIFQSTLASPGVPCLVVEQMSVCPHGGVGVDPGKPLGLENIDDILWNDLVNRVNPLARSLNRGMLTVFATYTVFVAAFLALFLTGASLVVSDLGFLPFPIFLLVLAVGMFGAISVIFYRNSGVDRQMAEVVDEFKPRFAVRGHDISYRTQYTGFCRPKHARSERILAFPVSGQSAAAASESAPTKACSEASDRDQWTDEENPSIIASGSGDGGNESPSLSIPGETSVSLVGQLKQDKQLYE